MGNKEAKFELGGPKRPPYKRNRRRKGALEFLDGGNPGITWETVVGGVVQICHTLETAQDICEKAKAERQGYLLHECAPEGDTLIDSWEPEVNLGPLFEVNFTWFVQRGLEFTQMKCVGLMVAHAIPEAIKQGVASFVLLEGEDVISEWISPAMHDWLTEQAKAIVLAEKYKAVTERAAHPEDFRVADQERYGLPDQGDILDNRGLPHGCQILAWFVRSMKGGGMQHHRIVRVDGHTQLFGRIIAKGYDGGWREEKTPPYKTDVARALARYRGGSA